MNLLELFLGIFVLIVSLFMLKDGSCCEEESIVIYLIYMCNNYVEY